jgi:hypothetical protein
MPRDMSQHRRAVLPSLLLLLLSAQRGTERSLQTREHPHRPARQSDKIVAAASELHSLAAARQHARWLTRVSRYDTCCLTAQPQTLSDVPAALTDARPEQLRRGNPLAVAPARALLVFRHRVADAASPHAVLAHESCLLVLLLPLLLRVAGRWWCRRARMRSAKAGTLCVCVCVCVCVEGAAVQCGPAGACACTAAASRAATCARKPGSASRAHAPRAHPWQSACCRGGKRGQSGLPAPLQGAPVVSCRAVAQEQRSVCEQR